MKKVLVLVITMFALSNVFANDGMGNSGEGREGKRPQMEQLNLTDAQKTQMKTLREKHRSERQAMQEKHKADIKAILTTEQWAKFEKMHAQRFGMEDGRRGSKGKKGDRHMEGGEPGQK